MTRVGSGHSSHITKSPSPAWPAFSGGFPTATSTTNDTYPEIRLEGTGMKAPPPPRLPFLVEWLPQKGNPHSSPPPPPLPKLGPVYVIL
jgi:hypothetical protein